MKLSFVQVKAGNGIHQLSVEGEKLSSDKEIGDEFVRLFVKEKEFTLNHFQQR